MKGRLFPLAQSSGRISLGNIPDNLKSSLLIDTALDRLPGMRDTEREGRIIVALCNKPYPEVRDALLRRSELYVSPLSYEEFREGDEDAVFAPLLPIFRTNTNKSPFDFLIEQKIYVRRSLPEALRFFGDWANLPSGIKEDKRVRAAFICSFGSADYTLKNVSVHSCYQSAPEFRLIAWGLGQLGLPVPKKFPDFQELYPATEFNTWREDRPLSFIESLIKSSEAPDVTDFFDQYRTRELMETFRHVSNKFQNVDINGLDDATHNALSAYLFGLARIFDQDLFIVMLCLALNPDFLPMIRPYIQKKYLIDNKEVLFNKKGELKRLAMASADLARRTFNTIGKLYEAETEQNECLELYANQPEIFTSFVAQLPDMEQEIQEDIHARSRIILRYANDMGFRAGKIDVNPDAAEMFPSLPSLVDAIKSQGESIFNNSMTAQENLDCMYNAKVSIPDADYNNLFGVLKDIDPDGINKKLNESIDAILNKRNRSVSLIQKGDIDAAQALLAESKSDESLIETEMLSPLSEELNTINEMLIELAKERESEEVQNTNLPTESASTSDMAAELEQLREQLAASQSKESELRNKLQKKEQESQVLSTQLASKRSKESGFYPELKKALFGRMNCTEMFELIQAEYPYVKFSDEFFTKVTQECKYSSISKLFKFVNLLCDEYYKAIMSGTPDSEAKDILGRVYRANESATVMGSTTLKNRRKFKFDGTKKLFTKHLTLGSNHDVTKTCQVYFDFDGSDLQIAYVGEHLPL